MERRQLFFNVGRLWTSLVCIILSTVLQCTDAQALDGRWELLVENVGIASMHAQVTRYGTVVLLDRTEAGASEIKLPEDRCLDNPEDPTLKHDCTAHSVEFTPGPNTVRPLFLETDTWCSSGQVTSNGTLVQTGGYANGRRKVRTFAPCAAPAGTCDWVESTEPSLQASRWYATNHILEDGVTQIIIGGSYANTTEYLPNANGLGQSSLELLLTAFLGNEAPQTWYPFVNLLPDGNLWIFANQDSIIYNYRNNTVMKKLPRIEGGPRNYPSAGSSVMLPLSGKFNSAEVLLCGGAQLKAYQNNKAQLGAQRTCGRMVLTAENPTWVMEDMPYPRTMGDMILLPTKDVLIINGAQNGSQGWDHASNPAFNPLLYSPDSPAGPSRFTNLTPSAIPRMYHSTANLLPDGRILIAGSNPHHYYNFTGVKFPTELRVEAFCPPYLASANLTERPKIVSSPGTARYGSPFNISFFVQSFRPGHLEVTMASAPFVTHSYAQGQRLLVLDTLSPTNVPGTFGTVYEVSVTAPPNAAVAPPGYYMTFVVNNGIPSVAAWIQVS